MCGKKEGGRRQSRTIVRTEVPLESLCSHVRFRDSDGQDSARLAEQGEVDVQFMTPLRDEIGALCESLRPESGGVQKTYARWFTFVRRRAALSFPIAQTRSRCSFSARRVMAWRVWIV